MPVSNQVIETRTATIASGATDSDGVLLGIGALCGIVTPAAFTGVTLALHVSADGTTFAALYDTAGAAVSVTVAPSRHVYIDPVLTAGWPYVRVVSGTAEAAARSVTLLVRPV